MKSFHLMPDSRMDTLMKVAEECIGLINIDIEPNAALKKLAKDNFLTDREVELVSHAVNNSRQLAQFQQSEPDARDKPFPLTNAELVNKDRYGKASEDSDHAEQVQDQPDAVEINDRIKKEASAANVEYEDYRLRHSPTLDTLALRQAFGVDALPKVASTSLSPVHPAQEYDVGIDEARTRAAEASDRATSLLNKVGSAFVNINSPSFALFEKAAALEGVLPELVEAIYTDANLAKYGAARADTLKKTATTYITTEIANLVAMVKEAEELVDTAADALVAKCLLDGYRNAALSKVAGFVSSDIKVGPQGLSDELSKGPSAFLGLGEDPSKGVMDIAGETKPEGYAYEFSLPQSISQDLKNVDTQSQLRGLLDDPYIKGYSLPEVIDAFNAARSVNPTFGQAQLTSYVRQHLATGGSIPLELQSRAARRTGDEE